MDNVAPIHSGINLQSSTPNEAVICALRNLLDMAESGQLQSFLSTGFTRDGLHVMTFCDFNDDKVRTLGSIEWLKTEWLMRTADGE